MLTILGRTTFRNEHRVFGIKREDRLGHIYIIGQTGTGKSTLIETMIRQDLIAGEGLAFLDPHGDVVERLVADKAEFKRDDIVYFNVPDPKQPWGLNPLRSVPTALRPVQASGLLEAIKKLWPDSWGPRTEHILRNALLASLDQPHATLADVLKLLVDGDFRREAMTRVQNIAVRTFWLREYAGYTARLRAEAIAPIQNKVGAFLTNPLLGSILSGEKQQLELRPMMDDGRVLLVNLAKGRVGEDVAALLGSLLVSSIGTTAMSRAEQSPSSRRRFWVYLDEFHTVTTLSVATMLSELRKYGVGFTMAHQYVAQVSDAVREAVFGNVGTIIAFRVGPTDATVLGPQFWPTLASRDLIGLPNHRAYIRLLVDGAPTEPFSGIVGQ